MKMKQKQIKNIYKNIETPRSPWHKKGRGMLKKGTLLAKERRLFSFSSDQPSDNT